MGDDAPLPITAESLARRDEWRRVFPGSETVWVEEADEGRGIGFDGLDPSAMVRAYRRVAAPWSDILGWYRSLFLELGWQERVVKDDWWWEWTSAARPGEELLVMDRTRIPDNWPAEVHEIWLGIRAEDPGTLFEVMFTAGGPFSAMKGDDA
jgi:hypothetical protein